MDDFRLSHMPRIHATGLSLMKTDLMIDSRGTGWDSTGSCLERHHGVLGKTNWDTASRTFGIFWIFTYPQ